MPGQGNQGNQGAGNGGDGGSPTPPATPTDTILALHRAGCSFSVSGSVLTIVNTGALPDVVQDALQSPGIISGLLAVTETVQTYTSIAAAGTSQATATPLLNGTINVITASSIGGGVILPASGPVVFWNTLLNAVQLYPSSTTSIRSGAVNASWLLAGYGQPLTVPIGGTSNFAPIPGLLPSVLTLSLTGTNWS